VTVVEVEGDVAVIDDTAEAFGLGLVTGLTVEPASLPAALFQGLTAVDVAGAVVATPVGLGLTGGDTVFCLGLVTVGDATPELRWGVLLPRPPPLNTTVLGSPEYPPCCLLSP
jgi:hypothetical protein